MSSFKCETIINTKLETSLTGISDGVLKTIRIGKVYISIKDREILIRDYYSGKTVVFFGYVLIHTDDTEEIKLNDGCRKYIKRVYKQRYLRGLNGSHNKITLKPNKHLLIAISGKLHIHELEDYIPNNMKSIKGLFHHESQLKTKGNLKAKSDIVTTVYSIRPNVQYFVKVPYSNSYYYSVNFDLTLDNKADKCGTVDCSSCSTDYLTLMRGTITSYKQVIVADNADGTEKYETYKIDDIVLSYNSCSGTSKCGYRSEVGSPSTTSARTKESYALTYVMPDGETTGIFDFPKNCSNNVCSVSAGYIDCCFNPFNRSQLLKFKYRFRLSDSKGNYEYHVFQYYLNYYTESNSNPSNFTTVGPSVGYTSGMIS